MSELGDQIRSIPVTNNKQEELLVNIARKVDELSSNYLSVSHQLRSSKNDTEFYERRYKESEVWLTIFSALQSNPEIANVTEAEKAKRADNAVRAYFKRYPTEKTNDS